MFDFYRRPRMRLPRCARRCSRKRWWTPAFRSRCHRRDRIEGRTDGRRQRRDRRASPPGQTPKRPSQRRRPRLRRRRRQRTRLRRRKRLSPRTGPNRPKRSICAKRGPLLLGGRLLLGARGATRGPGDLAVGGLQILFCKRRFSARSRVGCDCGWSSGLCFRRLGQILVTVAINVPYLVHGSGTAENAVHHGMRQPSSSAPATASAPRSRAFLAREGMGVGLAARRVEKLGALCEEIGAQGFACDAADA